MLLADIARTSRAVAATPKRTEKVAAIAQLLADAAPGEIADATAFVTGRSLLGRIGVGWATLADVRPEPADQPTLTVADVARRIGELATTVGSGSTARRRELLFDLLARSTSEEQELVRGILGGELRQGALDGVVTAAVAKAAGAKVADVRRAAMFAGSLPEAARVALTAGGAGLMAIGLTPSVPVQPMLAAPATDVGDALDHTGEASVEWKLDGARLQAHRTGGEVRLFTRNLNEVTHRLPGVVEIVGSLPGGDLVLDGEVMGFADDGTPRRFQDTMGDLGAEAPGRGSGLRPFFFDVLHADGPVVDEPLAARRELLADVVPPAHRLPSIVTTDPVEAQRFFDGAVAAGHEGVVLKDLAAGYDAGRRGGAWRKVKPVHTLDLVVLAVEWGHGRRRGWLSNLHLGARDTDGSFAMVGKTFKGLTDELLAWQTERFLALRIGEGTGADRGVVHVRPEQVVEVAIDGVQESNRYRSRVALRFARVRRYRADKSADEADTIDRVRGLLT